MLQLHYHPGNASLTPHILLEEIGVPFTLCLVDRAHGALQSPEYRRLNPTGLIPVLVDGDLVLFETAAICLHLAEAHPQAALVPPPGTPARAHCYKWLAWLATNLQQALMPYFYSERWVDEGNAEGARQVKAHAEARVATLVDLLDAELAARGGPWLLGDAYSIVDPYAMMLCRWTRVMQRPARTRTHVAPYLARVLARPAVERAFAAEGLRAPFV